MAHNKLSEILDLLVDSPNKNLRLELLELFLTDNEKEQLIARLEIIKGLVKGKQTQRELASSLKLSIAKITRGSNEMKRRSSELVGYLENRFIKGKKK